jgi:hypothetical protein
MYVTCHQGVSVRYFYAVNGWLVRSFRTITRAPYVVLFCFNSNAARRPKRPMQDKENPNPVLVD